MTVYPITRSCIYPQSSPRGRVWGGGGGGAPSVPVVGALIDDITWNAGHDFTAEIGGNIPGHNGNEVSLANQSSRSFTTNVGTGGFLERAIGTNRINKGLRPDGGAYQFLGSADPAFDYTTGDIHWRIIAVDDSDSPGGFATWFQRRNGGGLLIERGGSSNNGGQLQLTVFQNTGSPVSFTGGVPSPSQNGKALLIDLRQIASNGNIEVSVNGFHYSSAAALTTPLPALSNMTIAALNSVQGVAIWQGVRHNVSMTNEAHDIEWANSILAPRDGTSLITGAPSANAGTEMGADLSAGFSVSCWAQTTTSGLAEFCGAAPNSSWNANWGLDRYTRNPTFWVNSWNGADRITASADAVLNEWTHYAGVYDGDRLELFVNGLSQGSITGVTMTSTSNSGLMTLRGNGNFGSNGAAVDETAYFAGKALSSSEIALLATGVPATDVAGCTHRWATSNSEDLVGSLDLT